MLSRREFIASLAAIGSSSSARAEDVIILRRPPERDEDDTWYKFGQPGSFNIHEEPLILNFKSSKLIIHAPTELISSQLVVFSHGAISDPQIYRSILQHWASHGYIVVAPVHDDSIFERGILARTSSVEGPASWDVDQVLNDKMAWDARCEACRLAIEHTDLLEKTIGMKIDKKRPIIIGDEFGAFVVQLLLGAKVKDEDGKVFSVEDDRWFGGIAISPQGAGIMGLSENSWENVTKPLLVIQAGNQKDFTGQPPAKHLDLFYKSHQNLKHLGWFGSSSRDVAIQPGGGAGKTDIAMFEDCKALTTAFLYAYTKLDEDTFKLLRTSWASDSSRHRVETAYR